MANVKQVSGAEIDERLSALLTNVNAVRAIASAVEGTIGAKGLDTMLVDRFGDVVITNDGITILTRMEVNHPAARMVVNTAKAQEEEVGDGTTTATIMAGALLTTGLEHVIKGVPVTRVIEGVRAGVKAAITAIETRSRPISGVEDPLLKQVALVAGREHADIADLVAGAAALIGGDKLQEHDFKLADTVEAAEGAANEVFLGVLVDKQRLNKQMPKELAAASILVVDDALEPEEMEDEALGTEAGFRRYMELQDEFKLNLGRLVALGANVVMVDRGVSPVAEELLTDAGVMVMARVATRDLRRVAEHTGARPIKRTGLRKGDDELKRCLGAAELVSEDERLERVRVRGGKGKPMATVLVGAATREVVGERERIAKDAAASLQAAFRGGVVPGGGAVELAAAREVSQAREQVRGMSAYGIDCVVDALKRPLAQIVANAGFNPLEKIGDVTAAQAKAGQDSLGVDCDTGEIVDLFAAGVIDPTLVKTHALRAAGEIAEAILRIDTIIKMREGEQPELEDFSKVD